MEGLNPGLYPMFRTRDKVSSIMCNRPITRFVRHKGLSVTNHVDNIDKCNSRLFLDNLF